MENLCWDWTELYCYRWLVSSELGQNGKYQDTCETRRKSGNMLCSPETCHEKSFFIIKGRENTRAEQKIPEKFGINSSVTVFCTLSIEVLSVASELAFLGMEMIWLTVFIGFRYIFCRITSNFHKIRHDHTNLQLTLTKKTHKWQKIVGKNSTYKK